MELPGPRGGGTGGWPASRAAAAAPASVAGRTHRGRYREGPDADRRGTPVRLRAVLAAPRASAVRALALGAVARRDDGGRGLAPLAPAGRPGAAPARGRVRPPSLRPRRARAGAARRRR